MFKNLLTGAVVASALLSAPALATVNAVPIKFNFASNSANNNVADGNALTFKSNASSWGTFNMRATAWSLETTAAGSFLRDSKLQVWANGLGVLSGDDGDGSGNTHAVDNQNRLDFILLQFDRRLMLTGLTLTGYNVGGQIADSDLTIGWGNTTAAWNQSLNLNNQPLSKLQAMLTGTFDSLTSSTAPVTGTRAVNPDGRWGNVWLIAANATNADGRIDAFKLAGISAIPEASTWAMMIAGFGLAGVAVRRRQRTTLAFS